MTSEKGPSSCQVVRVLQPFAQLMHTSLKKAQILIQSEDEDARRRDITEVNPDFVLQSSLNDYLIYFKIAEKKVVETMEDSASQQLGKKSLKDLGSLQKELEPFLEKLERFWHEEEAIISEIESSAEFQEILACARNLHGRLEELDESEISNLLQMTYLNSPEHTICSILGLSDVVADSLKGIDP